MSVEQFIGYDKVVTVNEKTGNGGSPKLHVSLGDVSKLNKSDMTDKEMKLMKTELENTVSDAVKKNKKMISDIAFGSVLTQSIDKDDLLRPKIDFSLKELNLLPQVEAELLNNLTEYVKNKGLDGMKDLAPKNNKGEQ